MKKKRTTKITVEMERVLVVCQQHSVSEGWCAQCGAARYLLTPEQAAVNTGVSTRTLYRWIEADRIHFTETPDGRLLICGASLAELGPPTPAR